MEKYVLRPEIYEHMIENIALIYKNFNKVLYLLGEQTFNRVAVWKDQVTEDMLLLGEQPFNRVPVWKDQRAEDILKEICTHSGLLFLRSVELLESTGAASKEEELVPLHFWIVAPNEKNWRNASFPFLERNHENIEKNINRWGKYMKTFIHELATGSSENKDIVEAQKKILDLIMEDTKTIDEIHIFLKKIKNGELYANDANE